MAALNHVARGGTTTTDKMEAYSKIEAAIIQNEMENSVTSKAHLDALVTQTPNIVMALEIMCTRYSRTLNIDANNDDAGVNDSGSDQQRCRS